MDRLRRTVLLVCGLSTLIAAPATLSAVKSAFPTHVRPAGLRDGAPVPGREILGSSGNLRAVIGTVASLRQSPVLKPLLIGVPLDAPGIHALGLTAPDRQPLVVVAMESLEAMQGARLGAYRVGRWPTRNWAAQNVRYAPPPGFIPVTPGNASTLVSKRFRLRDFLAHDQPGVWPKVLVLQTALLDKLELIGDRLEHRGLPGSLHIMSGFRTPQYNARGVGRNGGRASESRHLYGDAADVFVDANGDGVMDDLDGDGKITIRDAQVLYAVAEGVEAEHPSLAGGLSAYPATAAHGPFVHIDARGVRARW